ncbi:MAG: S8 family serine peptidase [Chloroflexi bacterium]|nr:S8 family serine peptidase [Chloroflexota bacterium]
MYTRGGAQRKAVRRFSLGELGHARTLLIIAAVMTAVLGSSPAGEAGGALAQRTLQRAVLPEDLSPSHLRMPPSSFAPGEARGPVEVVIELNGYSLAEEHRRQREHGLPVMSYEAGKGYVQELKASQGNVQKKLAESGVQVLGSYQIALNGIHAVVDAGKLVELAALPQVSRVHRTKTVSRNLETSVPFIFGGLTREQLGLDGTGVTIAVIDTGIDYTHVAFGGSGDVAAYAANDPTVVEPGTFPTAKVIGGIDLVGEFFDPGCDNPGEPPACSTIPTPDADPLDLEGHGTHVASTAAGLAGGEVSQGVAPGARLLAVKVFGPGSTSDAIIAAAIEFALDPNQDGDTSDRVYVMNMSLGSPFGGDSSPDAVAANAAAELGVLVVASAGNNGDIPFVTGSPASASGAISVAASNDPGILIQQAQVLGSAGADREYESVEFPFAPPLAATGPLSGPTLFVGPACDVGGSGGPNPFAPASLAGKIPLVQRGACRFDEKVLNVQEAGAIAAVMFNNAPGGEPFAGAGDPIVSIPAVMIGNADGLAIRQALLPTTTFALDPAKMAAIPDRLQGFTSRGPRFAGSVLKPDISAPGGAIRAAAAGTGGGAISLSGTSMSSPHIAGVAALLRQLHPDWSAEEIRSLMMNTTTDNLRGGVPYPLSRMGAGRVQVAVAAHTQSVVTPSSLSFGVVEDDSGDESFLRRLTVSNKSTVDKTFQLSSSFLFPNDDEGSVIITHPRTVSVDAGESKTFSFRVEVDFEALVPESSFEEYEGFLHLVETTPGGDSLRVPFHIVPIARSEAEAEEDDGAIDIQNDGVRPTDIDLFQAGVEDPKEDLFTEAPGLPDRPDDWLDIRHTGARALETPDGRVVEFAVAVHGNRSVGNLMVTTVLMDVNKDGTPDYALVAADLGLLTGAAPDGRMLVALFDLISPAGTAVPQFFIDNTPNVSWQTLPVLLADLNALAASVGGPMLDEANPDFDYLVTTADADSGATDITDVVRFNALHPEVAPQPGFLTLAPDEEVTIPLTGLPGDRQVLILFRNNVSGLAQSQLISVELE